MARIQDLQTRLTRSNPNGGLMVDLAAFTRMFSGLSRSMIQMNESMEKLVDVNSRSLGMLSIMRAAADRDRFDVLESQREGSQIFDKMNLNLEKILKVLEDQHARENKGDSWAVFFGMMKAWALTHLTKIGALIAAPFKAMGKAFTGSVAILSKTITGIKTFINAPMAKLGGILSKLSAPLATIGAAIKTPLANIGAAASGLIGKIASGLSSIKIPNILPAALTKLVSGIGSAVSNVGSVLKGTMGVLVGSISGSIKAVKGIINGLKASTGVFKSIFGAITGVTKWFTGPIVKVFSSLGRFASIIGKVAWPIMAVLASFEIVPKVLQKLASGDIVGGLDAAVQGIYKFFVEDVVNLISNFFRDNLGMPAVADFLESTSSLFKSVIGDGTEGTGLLGAITKMFSGDFWGGVATFGDTVTALFDGFGSLMRDHIIPGIGSIIKSMWESLTWENIKTAAGGIAGLGAAIINGVVRMIGKIFGMSDEDVAAFDIKEIVKATAAKIVGIWDMMIESIKDLIRAIPGGKYIVGENPEELKKITSSQIEQEMEQARIDAASGISGLLGSDPEKAAAKVYESYKQSFSDAGVEMPAVTLKQSTAKAIQENNTPSVLEINPGYGEFGDFSGQELVQPTPPPIQDLIAPGTTVVPDAEAPAIVIPPAGSGRIRYTPPAVPQAPTSNLGRVRETEAKPLGPISSSRGGTVIYNEGNKSTTIVQGGGPSGGSGTSGTRSTTPVYEREQYQWRQFTSQ